MIVCQRCGKENQDHYKFCLGCGAELSSPAKPSGGGGDVAMMKTMMADVSHAGPGKASSPTPPGGVPASGLPGVAHGAQPGPPAGGNHGRQATSGGHGPGPQPGSPAPLPGAPMGPASGPYGSPAGNAGPPPGAPAPGGPPPGAPAPGMRGPGAAMGAPAGVPAGVPAPGPGGAGGPPPAGPPPGVPSASTQPPSAPSAGERPCPNCGTAVPLAFKFCGACGNKMTDEAPPRGRATADITQQPATATQPHGLLTLIKPDGSEGGTHALEQGENKIGRDHGELFENDGYLSPIHAEIVVNAAGAVVRDLDSLNGVFVKMTDEEEIQPGQILRIGQELLRFDLIEPPEPLEDGTEVMGSPNPGYWGKITVIIGNGVDGSAYPLLGDSVTLGRERGEINFPDDGYVSGLHARLSTRGGSVFLADLGSSNGTFVKVQGERELGDDSYVLLGQQLFRLNLR